ncbi:MAG: hypothetical protein KAI57_03480 [Candidatus Pacebacteria bacterium]|nr:hypothetical protein [Candidatus Paceibacterota bacterium]
MKNLIKTLTVSSFTAYALTASTIASAQWGRTNPPTNVPTDIEVAVMNLTNWILGFIAIIATLVIIWGGVQYLTAGGNDDAVGAAKKTISYGIIGMVIAGLAYAMVIVVTQILQ